MAALVAQYSFPADEVRERYAQFICHILEAQQQQEQHTDTEQAADAQVEDSPQQHDETNEQQHFQPHAEQAFEFTVQVA